MSGAHEESSTSGPAKRELAARTWELVQHYADAKSAVVAEIPARAPGAGPVP